MQGTEDAGHKRSGLDKAALAMESVCFYGCDKTVQPVVSWWHSAGKGQGQKKTLCDQLLSLNPDMPGLHGT